MARSRAATAVSIPAAVEQQRVLAAIFFTILRPLCDRFGIFRRKEAVENRAFELVEPVAYSALQREAKEFALHDRSIHAAQRQLQSLLEKEGMRSRVQGRLKSLYSIHLKRTQHIEHRLYDLYACRVILRSNNEQDCYRALSLLHHRFMAVPERFKDYVAIPKLNGYQSLHTVLTDLVEGIPMEIQIRTDAMHAVAEEGIAAHWRYAIKKQRDLSHQSLTMSDNHTGIFVLTPKHDIMHIPVGTTARTFAGIVHSRLLRSMKGVTVNDVLVSPDTVLQDGDRVDILTSLS